MGHRARAGVVTISLWLLGSDCTAQPPSVAEPAPKLSVAGQVVDPDGKPLAGARVVLREWSSIRYSDDPYQADVHDVLAESTSDADGRFQFADVQSRPFRVHRDYTPWDVVALADGFALGWVHLKAANDDRDLTVSLHRAKQISGRLIDPDGRPVEGCSVRVAAVEAPHSQWHTDFTDPMRVDLWRSQLRLEGTTDEDGRFDIRGAPSDKRLTLIAEHPDFARGHIYVATTDDSQPPVEQASVQAGKRETEHQPVHMSGFTETLQRGGRVRGRVVLADTGKPVPRAKVSATWQNRAHYEVADKEGRFEFTSMLDPQYHVASSTEEPGYLAARELVEFRDGQWQHEVDLRLPRGVTVRGTVSDEDSGDGVAGVGVQYFPADYDDQSGWTPAKSATTDASGRFEIIVPPGPGMVRVYGGIGRHPTYDVPDFWRLRSKQSLSPGHSAKIDVAAGQEIDDVKLTVGRGLVIRGRVVDENAQPVFAAVIHVTDRFGRAEFEKRTVTDEDGRFELSGFPPHEEHKIELMDVDRALRATHVVAADSSAGASRVVELGDIALGATGTVVGTVLGDGKPLAGVRVFLSAHVERDGREEIKATGQQTETGPDGRFRFEAVEAGSRVSAYASTDGYTSQGTLSYPLAAGKVLEIPPIGLKSRGAFVAGIVVDPNGKPVAGVTVSASEQSGGSISFGRQGPPAPTDAAGRFRLNDLPNVPLKLLAYIRAPAETKDRSIHFPARVNAEPGQTDVRIVLDPKLQRPLP